MCYNLTSSAYSREGLFSKTPEITRAKMSASFKERSKNLDYIKRKSDSAKIAWSSQDYRDKMIQVAKSEKAIERFKKNRRGIFKNNKLSRKSRPS